MSGVGIIICGFVVLISSTAGMAAIVGIVQKKKKRMREELYHIYE